MALPIPMPSETELQRDLNNTSEIRSLDRLPERRTPQCADWNSKVRTVQSIEKLRSEIEPLTIPNREALAQCDIQIDEALRTRGLASN